MKANPWKEQIAMYYLSNGTIEVDSEGRIWKLKDKRGNPNNQWTWRDIERRRIGSKTKNYLQVVLYLNGKINHVLAHRIVWLFYHGLIPEGLEINHKNGVRDDNHPDNLELVTPSENVIHGYEKNGRITIKGECHRNAKLTEKEVLEIRSIYKDSEITFACLGRMYNIGRHQANSIVKRESWKHI